MDPTAFGETRCSQGSEQACQPTLQSSQVHPALTVPQNQRTPLERAACEVCHAPKHVHAHCHGHSCMYSNAHVHLPAHPVHPRHTPRCTCNVLTHLSLSSDVPRRRPWIPSPCCAACRCHISAACPPGRPCRLPWQCCACQEMKFAPVLQRGAESSRGDELSLPSLALPIIPHPVVLPQGCLLWLHQPSPSKELSVLGSMCLTSHGPAV